jgi:hypothetical protein
VLVVAVQAFVVGRKSTVGHDRQVPAMINACPVAVYRLCLLIVRVDDTQVLQIHTKATNLLN